MIKANSIMLFGSLFLPMTSESVSAQNTVFDISMTFVYDRLPPSPYPGIRNNVSLTVTLSGRNTVSAQRTRNVGRYAESGHASSTLGGGAGAGGRGAAWRVVNSSTIQGTTVEQASIRVITITTTGGNSCAVSVSERLKPGATTYQYRRMDGGGMGNFTRPELVSSSCTVR